MKLPKFRNAIVYRATLPGIEAIEGHLLELPYSEIGDVKPLYGMETHFFLSKSA